MKLSEAIRLGSMLRPQGHRMLMSGGATCALGAALEAIGEDVWRLNFNGDSAVDAVVKRAGWIDPEHVCPACGEKFDGRDETGEEDGFYVIAHLNDVHKWTREAIADWVEQIERAQEPTSQPVSSESPSESSVFALALTAGDATEQG
jgi:hypothetical protein